MVLTAQEKQVILFVVATFLLGITVKFYRDRHPQGPAKPQPFSAPAIKHQPSSHRSPAVRNDD